MFLEAIEKLSIHEAVETATKQTATTTTDIQISATAHIAPSWRDGGRIGEEFCPRVCG